MINSPKYLHVRFVVHDVWLGGNSVLWLAHDHDVFVVRCPQSSKVGKYNRHFEPLFAIASLLTGHSTPGKVVYFHQILAAQRSHLTFFGRKRVQRGRCIFEQRYIAESKGQWDVSREGSTVSSHGTFDVFGQRRRIRRSWVTLGRDIRPLGHLVGDPLRWPPGLGPGLFGGGSCLLRVKYSIRWVVFRVLVRSWLWTIHSMLEGE